MKYLEWNHIIGEYFFNPSNAGKEVLLYLTQKEISELGIIKFGFTSEAQSWEDYCKAIKCGFPETSSKSNFIDKFLVVANKWKYYEKIVFEQNNKADLRIESVSIYSPTIQIVYPFYLGYLVTLVIPLTDNVNTFRANSFFPKLNNFLNLNGISNDRTGTIADIDWVWYNLENWSKEYCKTDFGLFTERRLGNQNWVYVNKAFSQCLLTPKNIRDIPNIFWKACIAPDSIITENQILRVINIYGKEQANFSNSVLKIINDEENPLKKVIVDIVRREYENWKGYVIEYDEDEKVAMPKSGWIYSIILSAFTLNREDETFNHFYYLYSQNDFPEELNFGEYEIKSSGNGFSKPINIDFNQGLNLTDDQNKWRASSTQKGIVIYSSGSYFGLPSDNFIETDKISRQSSMYLLCTNDKKQVVDDWGSTFLKEDFSPIQYDRTPPGFHFYRFKNPQQSHPTEELLRVSTKKRVEIRGGIKIGNRGYLRDRLPKVYIEGANGKENLFLEFKDVDHKIYLIRNALIPEEFIIPANVLCNQSFLIKDENEKLDNSELPYQIVDIDFNPLDIIIEHLPKRNKFGEICNDDDTSFVIGSNTIYDDWPRQLSWVFPFFSSIYNKTEFITNKNEYNLKKGNLILQILSIKRNLKFQEFSDIIDSIENDARIWELSIFQQNSKYIKQTSISFYDYLGFLDYDYSLNKISVNKPQFVIIPSTATFKAILIGGRSKSFIDKLQDKCNKHQINLEIIPQATQLDIYYLPDLIRLTPTNCKNSTEAWKRLQTIAFELNIELRITNKPYTQPQITQFGLQDFSETIYSYKENVLANKLVEKPNYEWSRKVFDTNILKFIKDTNSINKALSLQEYYVQYQYTYILWFNNKSYEVDRNWGKFLLLSEQNKKVIFYNQKTQELAIPKYVQLPRLIAKSIMLLSGQVPYYKSVTIEGCNLVYQFYQNVPKLFAENLFKKFNQQIQFKNNW